MTVILHHGQGCPEYTVRLILWPYEYRKLTTFIPAFFASSDLELLKLLKRPLALQHYIHPVPSIDKSSMGSGCEESFYVHATAETCED